MPMLGSGVWFVEFPLLVDQLFPCPKETVLFNVPSSIFVPCGVLDWRLLRVLAFCYCILLC